MTLFSPAGAKASVNRERRSGRLDAWPQRTKATGRTPTAKWLGHAIPGFAARATRLAAGLTAALIWTLGGVGPAMAACADQPGPCALPSGSYHIALPPTSGDEPVPALLFLHGAGSSGAGAMRLSGLRATLHARGYAFMAADGLPRPGTDRGSWSFHPDRESRRDEPGFFADIVTDAAARHGVDPARVILAGFSIGGSMTAYTACAQPDLFSAYAPLGGNFWRPHPTSCAGPVRLFHTHGWRDTTVPLEGRILGGGRIVQGDVFHAFEIWRQTNGCDQLRADRFVTDGPFWRRAWDRCAPGSALELALFPGGHGIPRGWVEMVLDWYENL